MFWIGVCSLLVMFIIAVVFACYKIGVKETLKSVGIFIFIVVWALSTAIFLAVGAEKKGWLQYESKRPVTTQQLP